MFLDDKDQSDARVTTWTALRHVLLFQIKLAADALRDFVMSPLSLIAFAVDALRKPRIEDSLYLRLMLLGRRTDRTINLFDEHRDAGAFTIDRAADELEELVRKSAASTAADGQDSESQKWERPGSEGQGSEGQGSEGQSSESQSSEDPRPGSQGASYK